jgi:hypothetical protein
VNQRNLPVFGVIFMNFHAVLAHIESYITIIKCIVGEIFFYDMPFVTATNNKLVNAEGGIDFHNMPKNRLATNFYHRLRPNATFFTDTGTITTCKDNCFHKFNGCFLF